MPVNATQPGWRIYSAQRSVPFTVGRGQHNYLVLVDPSGRVHAEIHGTSGQPFGGKLRIEETKAQYDKQGTRTNANPDGLGDEDRSNWVEIPPIDGKTPRETWVAMKVIAAKYTEKYEYFFAPSDETPKTPRLGDTEGQLYETMPRYNSNSAWRTILEDLDYDYRDFHPKEGIFQVSPGDGHRLPPIKRTPPRRPARDRSVTPQPGPRRDEPKQNQRRQRSLGPGDLLR